MRFVQIGDRSYINLAAVSDITVKEDGNEITFYFPFSYNDGDQYYIIAGSNYAPDLIKALRNEVYPFSDNRG